MVVSSLYNFYSFFVGTVDDKNINVSSLSMVYFLSQLSNIIGNTVFLFDPDHIIPKEIDFQMLHFNSNVQYVPCGLCLGPVKKMRLSNY